METRLEIMREMVGDVEHKDVLEIGIAQQILSWKECELTTLDVDESLCPTVVHDLNETPLPFNDQSFSVIIFGEVIEHLISPIKFLKECHRILGKGGIIVLSFPNISSLKNRVKGLFGCLPEHCARASVSIDEYINGHLKDFNLPDMKGILEVAGFKIIQDSSNGIKVHNKLFFPISLTPTSFGECIILKCYKIGETV